MSRVGKRFRAPHSLHLMVSTSACIVLLFDSLTTATLHFPKYALQCLHMARLISLSRGCAIFFAMAFAFQLYNFDKANGTVLLAA